MSNLTPILLVLVERRQLDRFCLQLCNRGQFLIGVSSQMGNVLDWPHCIGFWKQKEIPTVVALGGWWFQNVSNGFHFYLQDFHVAWNHWDSEMTSDTPGTMAENSQNWAIHLPAWISGRHVCRILGPKSLQHDLTISSWTYRIMHEFAIHSPTFFR